MNDTVRAIYVALNGLNDGWVNTGGEDITFINQLNTALDADLCVDQNLRFSTSFSYGVAMSSPIAHSLAKDFRAVAVCLATLKSAGVVAMTRLPITASTASVIRCYPLLGVVQCVTASSRTTGARLRPCKSRWQVVASISILRTPVLGLHARSPCSVGYFRWSSHRAVKR